MISTTDYSKNTKPIGVLLVNLGTPNAPNRKAVRCFLREFLMDPFVVDLPYLIRWVLVHGLILPFRPKYTTHAYQQIWSTEGSPLLVHSQKLCAEVQNELGQDFRVILGMRYGNPNLISAIQSLKKQNCEKIIIIPLFPQYAQATTGSIINKIKKLLKKQPNSITHYLESFHVENLFIEACVAQIKEIYQPHQHDILLFSYHGLPERQDSNHSYRQQCQATTQAIAAKLNLDKHQYQFSFQSRLERIPWITPYTDEVLKQLAAHGKKNIAIFCPSFVADCLETLEEIGIRAKAQWQILGGQTLTLIPCLNSHPQWVKNLSQLIKHQSTNSI